MNIVNSYRKGDITSYDRNKLLTRMVSSLSLNFGSSWAAVSFFTGPIGICIAVGACIAISLGDYFLGDKIASLFFTRDEMEEEQLLKKKCDEIEKEVCEKAYSLLDLTEHCTDKELKDAYLVASLKYHPDKCGADKKETNTRIFQGVNAAYSFLKEKRSKQTKLKSE